MTHRLFALITLALGIAGSGCATMHPRAHAEQFRYTAFGEAMEARQSQKDFRTSFKKDVEVLEPAQIADLQPEVKLLERQFPNGVEVKDGVVAASAGSGYEVLGTFNFSPARGSAVWFADYNSVGKKVLCYPQVPLTWVTLMLWQAFVPLSYPCVSENGLPAEEAYGYVRQAAVSAGSNVVVLTNVAQNEEVVWSMAGIFLRFHPAPVPGGPANHEI